VRPALFEPDSVTWRVMKNPVALVVGGFAAVILELAEPRVRSGVWEHTSFRTRSGDPHAPHRVRGVRHDLRTGRRRSRHDRRRGARDMRASRAVTPDGRALSRE
jgi:hypothetical protein